jgi:RNA-directed DNA polymerase
MLCPRGPYRRVERPIWRMLWHWAKRRHPNKSGTWLADRYWKTVAHRKWVFSGIEDDTAEPDRDQDFALGEGVRTE